jgi:hypothetical protein
MRKFGLIAAAAIVFAMLPLGAVAATTPAARAHAHWFAGSVSAVGSDSLSVNVLWTGPKDGQLNGQAVTVAVNSDTKIVNGKDRSPAQLSDIKPGDLVSLRATSSDTTLTSLTATHIRIWCNCNWIGGTISSIGTGSFNVQVARTGPYDTVLKSHDVTIQVNASTTYVKGKGKTPITFADLKVGDGVGVIFGADGFFTARGFDPSKATFTATRVHDWQKRLVPPPASDSGGAAGTTP